MSLQVPYKCGINCYFGMQTSHVIFFPFGLKVACCFFYILPWIQSQVFDQNPSSDLPAEAAFPFLVNGFIFFGGGEAIKHPLPETKGSSKNPWVGQFLSQAFLSKRGKIKALKSQGAKGFAL